METEGYECVSCWAKCEEPSGALYECSCGTRFNKEETGSHRCPACNKFAQKVAEESCPECNADEVEPCLLFRCTHCEDVVAEAEFPKHDCRAAVRALQAAEAARQAVELQAEAGRAERRAEIAATPLRVELRYEMEDYGAHQKECRYLHYYECQVNGIYCGEAIEEWVRDDRLHDHATGRSGWEFAPNREWQHWERDHLLASHTLPTHTAPARFPTLAAALEDMVRWVRAHLPVGTELTVIHEAVRHYESGTPLCETQRGVGNQSPSQAKAHPELPLHNNAEELDVRRRVRKREISFGPVSAAGAKPRTLSRGRPLRRKSGRSASGATWSTALTSRERSHRSPNSPGRKPLPIPAPVPEQRSNPMPVAPSLPGIPSDLNRVGREFTPSANHPNQAHRYARSGLLTGYGLCRYGPGCLLRA